jgi:hypothetical protein
VLGQGPGEPGAAQALAADLAAAFQSRATELPGAGLELRRLHAALAAQPAPPGIAVLGRSAPVLREAGVRGLLELLPCPVWIVREA